MEINNNLIKFIFFIEKVICKLKFPLTIQKLIDSLLYVLVQSKIKKYLELAEKNIDYTKKNKSNNVAWIFWLQGIESAPDIVKACVNSVKENFNYNVIVLSKENLKQYVDIPEYIYEKLDDGEISKTHFSDIVRFNLLRNNGGIWIDSTVLCVNQMDDILNKDFYTSAGKNDSYPFFIEGKWTGFVIGGLSNEPMFQFMDEFFKIYWNKNNSLVNYFLIDYAIKYAYDHNIGRLKSYIDNYALKNNPRLFDLQPKLNDVYEKKVFNDLCESTSLFKLSYKKNISNKINSYYSFIINKWI